MQGKTQEAAAAAAGMSVRSAGKWQRGLLPAERKSPRTWRTRPDPFTGIWNDVIEPLLRRDPESALQATTVLDWLEERYLFEIEQRYCPLLPRPPTRGRQQQHRQLEFAQCPSPGQPEDKVVERNEEA